MTRHPLLNQDAWLDPDDEATKRVEEITEHLSPKQFEEWYREWQFRQNIEDGNSYFNKTGYVPDAERQSPSKLMQCHRKQWYKAFNAPAEEEDPLGIFWTGEKFEEEIIMPFLSDFAGSINGNNYVQNSMWIDVEIPVTLDSGEETKVRIRGETDPVVVDRRGNPLLVTEVKNKKSLDKFEKQDDPEPDIHHKAQIHAYMYGLSESFERSVKRGVLLYGSRNTHDLLPIEVEFDPDFWQQQVVEWAKKQTEYRLNEELPPIDPQFSWECRFCEYSNRCGMGDDPPWYNDESDRYPSDAEWQDSGANGFLPLTNYPLDHVIEYMRAHAPDGAKLTPTLEEQYPFLRDKFDVYNWVCEDCDKEIGRWRFDWDGDTDNPPNCPTCDAELRGPLPENQH